MKPDEVIQLHELPVAKMSEQTQKRIVDAVVGLRAVAPGLVARLIRHTQALARENNELRDQLDDAAAAARADALFEVRDGLNAAAGEIDWDSGFPWEIEMVEALADAGVRSRVKMAGVAPKNNRRPQ